ncbi:MAG: citramalate synthase [Verrucomicrobiales bacterium]|jgi:2-isopropylmalate synthase|nr:citramalate synthase [Verrucomicrobiales bacterium]
MKSNVTIYDTTLRDGSQGEGINFSLADKLKIAERLSHFGVHYIEGGWPGSNEKDIAFFNEAKKRNWGSAKIAAFGSTRKAGVAVEKDPQVNLLLEAETPVVTFFGKSWLLHVEKVLRTIPEENLRMIADTVAYLKKHGREVIYDAEHFFDGYKASPEYALKTLQAAQDAGADYLVLCDTNGGTLPSEVAEITVSVSKQVKAKLGIHSHNDCGLGVANALAAIEHGALQVQGTINGFGERTGNCNLTSVIPILELKLKQLVLPEGHLRQLSEISCFVDEIANLHHDTRAPFVGLSSFAHKGGMHVNAVNKSDVTYEHIDPALVGNQQRILVGELSGRTNVMMKARELGIKLEEKDPRTKQILDLVKSLENEGYEFEAADASFELLIRKNLHPHAPFFELVEYHTSFRRNAKNPAANCEATLYLNVNGNPANAVAKGDGPVNALDQALRQALITHYPQIAQVALIDYKVRIINSSSGTAARTRVLIISSDGKNEWGTVGVSDNVIEASWLALVDSVEYHLLRQSAK